VPAFADPKTCGLDACGTPIPAIILKRFSHLNFRGLLQSACDPVTRMSSATHEIRGKSDSGLRWALLAVPVYAYIATCWLTRPLGTNNIALAYLVPLSFVIGAFLFRVPRSEFVSALRSLRVELMLTMLMSALCMLSIINSDSPFEIFRILFPSIFPLLLFLQLVPLRAVSPRTVADLPRLFLVTGVFFSCTPLLLSPFLPGLESYLFPDGPRYHGLLDHPNQQSAMIAVLVPLAIAEMALEKSGVKRLLWVVAIIVMIYTMVRTGSKTAIFVTFACAWLFYILAHARVHSLARNVMRIVAVLLVMVFLAVYGLEITRAIDPVTARNIEAILSEGVENYRTIEARMVLWREAWIQGSEHWIIGTGAGEPMADNTRHAHNLFLDYFRGIGLFGAIAVMLLCARVLWRAVSKVIPVLTGRVLYMNDIRILACYAASGVYIFCNQLSNSFGPATIGALWIVYLSAVLSERPPGSQPARTGQRGLSADPVLT
jgi:O-antigen ligase